MHWQYVRHDGGYAAARNDCTAISSRARAGSTRTTHAVCDAEARTGHPHAAKAPISELFVLRLAIGIGPSRLYGPGERVPANRSRRAFYLQSARVQRSAPRTQPRRVATARRFIYS